MASNQYAQEDDLDAQAALDAVDRFAEDAKSWFVCEQGVQVDREEEDQDQGDQGQGVVKCKRAKKLKSQNGKPDPPRGGKV